MEHYLLSLVLFFPALAGLFGFMVAKDSIRTYGILMAAIELILSLLLWIDFDQTQATMQFREFYPLIPSLGISYYLGIDGFSLFLVILTTFMTLIALIGLSITENVKNLIISVLFLEMAMVGVFVALDAILFYIFWEFSLIPMFYIIGAWGGEKRIYAAIKFFLYTFAGSLIMLVGMLYMAWAFHKATGVWSFAITDWHMLVLPFDMQFWLFLAFFLGFAIKVPMFPFHTWLPYAHGQAPTIGSVILAAVLLKMGTYGFIRFSLPMFPDASVYFTIPIAVLSLIMIVYTAMVAYAQEDMKQVVAYSSISHMGVVMLGIFALNAEGIGGSVFLMISHGVVSGALFMIVGVIYDRLHTKQMKDFGGIARVMPRYGTITGLVVMASVGLPLTIGFVGEFLSLLGFYRVSPTMTLIAGTTIILGAVYMLTLYKRSFFGEVTNLKLAKQKDLDAKELFSLVPIAIIIVWLGLYPKPILGPVDVSAKALVNTMYQKSIIPESREKISLYNSITKEQ
ncbi:MAG: NADH-quinone oxidoreductase subunit M [Campylobacterales bacterium]